MSAPRFGIIAAFFLTFVAPSVRAQVTPVGPADVEAARATFVSALRAKETVRLRPVLTRDAIMIRGAEGRFAPVVGDSAVIAFYDEMFRDLTGPNPLVLRPQLVQVGGRWALEEGAFGPDAGQAVGSYVIVYRRGASGTTRVAYWRFASAASLEAEKP